MRSPVRRTFSGLTIEITPLGFTAQRSAFVLLTRTLGPAFVELLAGLEPKATSGTKIEALKRTALEAMTRIDEPSLVEITAIFAPTSRALFSAKEGPYLEEAAVQERAFGEDFGRYLEWLRACVEVNFGPFFAWLAALVSAPTPDPKESTDAPSAKRSAG